MVKNESIDNICVENLSANQEGQRVILGEFKKLPSTIMYQVRLEHLLGAGAGGESGADIAVLLVELDFSYGSLRSNIS